MNKSEKNLFLRTALAMKEIELAGYNEMVELLEGDPNLDPAALLIERGLIDENGVARVREAASRASTSRAAGKTFSENYKVERVLGQGGVGRVFLALEKNIGREVAIKELIGERLGAGSARAMARFVREAKISGQLEHPNIVPVYRLETRPDGSVYYVMRHVEGRTMLSAIQEHAGERPEKALAARLSLLGDFIAVCEAVGFAHSRGIIHRDLKPSNVLLGEFGETIVLDWGLAKRLSDPETNDSVGETRQDQEEDLDGFKTIVGARLGTPPYMAPEQVNRELGTVDARSDVYALGVILYLILTGEKPYSGNAKEMMEMIASDAPSPSPRVSRLSIPPELAAICEKAMQKVRDKRFADAGEMAHELKAYRDGRLVGVYAYSRMELFRRFISRNKVAVAAAVAVVLSIAAGLAFASHYAVVADRERRHAENALVEVTRISEEAVDLARTTVDQFNNFFRNLAMEIGAAASTPPSAEDQAKLRELLARRPEVGALILTRAGKVLSVPADAIGRYGLPPPGIDRVRIEAGDREFEATDAWKSSDGRYAFAFVFNASAGGEDTLTAIFTIDRIMPAAFAFDPRKHPYQIWCMDEDGTILYDENPAEIGKNLFTDAMYESYPELRTLGAEMREKAWGVGYYRFFAGRSQPVIYKIAAWETLTPAVGVNWKLVAAFPYESK